MKSTRLLRETMDLNVTRTKDLKEITYVLTKAKALPRINNKLLDITFVDFKTKKLRDAMSLAGYNHEYTIGSGANIKCVSGTAQRRAHRQMTGTSSNHYSHLLHAHRLLILRKNFN